MKAIDNAGNESDKTVKVVSDRIPPVLDALKEKIIKLRRGKEAEIILTGTDNYKLGKIEIIGTLPKGMTTTTISDGENHAYLKITGVPTNPGKYQLT